jgi:hypothetical protein
MRGGDKALLRRKAKAKARRYAPLIKNVDESFSGTASCLTGFVNDFRAPRLLVACRRRKCCDAM